MPTIYPSSLDTITGTPTLRIYGAAMGYRQPAEPAFCLMCRLGRCDRLVAVLFSWLAASEARFFWSIVAWGLFAACTSTYCLIGNDYLDAAGWFATGPAGAWAVIRWRYWHDWGGAHAD